MQKYGCRTDARHLSEKIVIMNTMINLLIKQDGLDKSGESALEEFKSVLVNVLNSFPADRHVGRRWDITKVSEGNEAYLLYDEKLIATLKIQDNGLEIQSPKDTPRYDDILYSIRYAAQQLSLAAYSANHGGARLPRNSSLSLDHTHFQRDPLTKEFFAKSNFIPRYAPQGIDWVDDNRQALAVYAPYYAEHKHDGSVHILNEAMLAFLTKKDDQRVNDEFSYQVAHSMDDFARKYDLGLVPAAFYQNYGVSPKIINDTYFDAQHINRKVFIDPYVYDFDDEHDSRYYQNVKNGMHLMDKVRKGENLEQAIKRVLREELEVAHDFVGAKIWDIDFDRDRDGILTPRLKINVFVHGMHAKRKSQSHDWVPIK